MSNFIGDSIFQLSEIDCKQALDGKFLLVINMDTQRGLKIPNPQDTGADCHMYILYSKSIDVLIPKKYNSIFKFEAVHSSEEDFYENILEAFSNDWRILPYGN